MNQEIIKAFITLGLTEKESKVLVLILDIKTVPTREFERLLDMRQPEVSTALKNLQSRGWIRNGEKIKSQGMARSGNTYELCYSPSEIIDELKKEYALKQAEFTKSIDFLGGR